MKRIEALKIILAWWAYAYGLQEDETNMDQPLDWVLGEAQDHQVAQALLVYFGTVSPPSSVKVLFIKVWGNVVKDKIFHNIPKYMLGQLSLDDIILESIL